jgi:hypothetical protein
MSKDYSLWLLQLKEKYKLMFSIYRCRFPPPLERRHRRGLEELLPPTKIEAFVKINISPFVSSQKYASVYQ